MTGRLVLVESNTTGTGRLFARQAAALGHEPVLLAADPGKYPYARQDRLHCVQADTSDPAAVLSAVRSLGGGVVAGVTSSSEYAVATAAEVASQLDRPGPSAPAVEACRDKFSQRRTLAAAQVPVPGFALARDAAEAAAAAVSLGTPVVVKPRRGSGSTGVRWCATAGDAARHASGLLAAGEPGVLVERYLSGAEYSVETFGDDQVVAVVGKHLGGRPAFVEIGHDLPPDLTSPEQDRLGRCALRAVAALGLGWGAAHVELRLQDGHPYVIEVNPRLAGGMIPEAVRLATGVDLVHAQVSAALGMPVDVTPAARRAAAIRFLVAHADGRMGATSDPLHAARAVPGVADARLYPDEGARIGPAADFRGRLGHVIAVADDPPAARAAADLAIRHLGDVISYGGQS